MNNPLNTEVVIEALVAASGNATSREKHIYRETLLSLVRLAKSEQIAAMKKDIVKFTEINEDHSVKIAA